MASEHMKRCSKSLVYLRCIILNNRQEQLIVVRSGQGRVEAPEYSKLGPYIWVTMLCTDKDSTLKSPLSDCLLFSVIFLAL
jgi:hypothetical protein